MNLSDLKKKIPYQWKIQSVSKDGKKGSFVAYIDARDVMNLLDEAVGPGNWQDKYEKVGDHLIAGIGISLHEQKLDWVWKYDTGTESDYEKEKGLFSDAFKRAAVKWGIGRFLYDLEIQWLPINDKKKPIDEYGNEIKDVTSFLNRKNKISNNPPAMSYDNTLPPINEEETAQAYMGPETPKKLVCPKCGKEHQGKYPKCYQCYLAEKN